MLYDFIHEQGGQLRHFHWHKDHTKFLMNWLIGCKFKTGHFTLCSVVRGTDVSEEPDASVIAARFIRHYNVSADFDKLSVEIYHTTLRHRSYSPYVTRDT
jgi:hypothetical protein